MKKFKKVNSFVAIALTFSILFGSFSLPVFAYEKGGVDFEQFRTKILSNTNRTTLNKLNSVFKSASDPSQDLAVIKKESTVLEKSQQTEEKKNDYVEGEILVKYKNTKINLNTTSGRANALNFIRSKSLENKEDLRKNNISVLKIKDAKTVEQKIVELKNDPNVEYVQPNFQYYPSEIISNDINKDRLWGLDNTGQTVNGFTPAGPGADINAPEAWAINEGNNSSVIVAVIDTGVAYNHPDLSANMWDGTACVSDTNTALGSCNHGYDYEDNDKTPLPTTSSHGTHIAGIIAALKNNAIGIIGVAPQAKIIALKSSLTTAENVKAINFAKYNGAKVINASWGAYGTTNNDAHDVALYNAIKDFPGLFIAAAGNGSNTGAGFNHDDGIDSHKSFPSYFKNTTSIGSGLNNIISVAATDQNDALATFSDYGAISVDIGAPGVNILSTIADSNLLNETFTNITAPNIPVNWTKDGTSNNWRTFNLGGPVGNVLYGDVSLPYTNNANTTVTSPTYNLNGSATTIDFITACDTEYVTDGWVDYMALEYSNDGGSNFTEILKWDEAGLDFLNDDSNQSGSAVYEFSDSIPSQYLTSNFQFRLRWVTDSLDNNYKGCLVDDVKITKFSDGSDEKYDYYKGTSMAAPHVAGLAALIEGYNSALTSAEVKNIILTTGDSVASLAGTTVSGKRINAQKALQAVNPAKAITAFSFATPASTGVITEVTHTIAITVPFGTVITALVPTIIITGTSISPLSGVANNFTTPQTYTVTAADGSTQAYVVTLTVAANPDITAPTISSYTLNGSEQNVVFNPNDPASVSIVVNASEPVKLTRIKILNSANVIVKYFTEDTNFVTTATKVWDGKNSSNVVVPDGVYKLQVNIKDVAGIINNNLNLTPYTITVDTVDTVVPPTDFTALNFAIVSAQSLVAIAVEGTVPGNHVIGSKAILEAAILDAQAVSVLASQIVVDATVTTLNASINTFNTSLVGLSDLSGLVAVIASAQAIYNGAVEGTAPGEYAVGSKAILQSAVDVAGLVTSAEAQSVVNVAVATLNDAVSVFQASVVGDSDLIALNVVIASAQAIDLAAVAGTAPGQYPVSTKNIFQAAIAVAQTVNASVDQSIVDVAVVTLNDAVIAFQATVIGPSDLSALSAVIASAQILHDTAVDEGTVLGDHVIGSKAILQSAIDAALLITSSQDQSVVDAAVTALNTAVAIFEASIVLPDTTPPIITLLGDTTVNLTVGDSYIDAGATAFDNVDGDITVNNIVVVGRDAINTSIVGEYIITYNVSDLAGNPATEVSRTVFVSNPSSDDEETATALATAKTIAVSELAAYKNATDYRTAEQITLAVAITNGNTAINEATDTAGVAIALNSAKGVIDLIKTGAQFTAEETTATLATLVAAKISAHSALTTALATYTQGNYTAGNWTILTGFKTAGDTAIDASTNLAGVTSAQTIATAGMSGVQKIINQNNNGGSRATRTVPATPAGQVLGASIGPIPGCDNRTTGFSIITGKSCIGNTGITVAGQVLGAEKFTFTKIMRQNSQGNEVMELQKFLNTKLSLGLIADGKFGPKTKVAVVKFQVANKLTGDGVVGALTRAVLNK